MRYLFQRGGTVTLMAAMIVGALYFALGYDDRDSAPELPVPRIPAAARNRSTNLRLADDFIKWYQAQYVNSMRRVGGMSTDIDDLVQDLGYQQAVERYSRTFRIVLDYAMMHPDQAAVPDADLEEMAQTQREMVMSNFRSSRRWVDHQNEKTQQGILNAYKQGDLALIPFFQRLLATPTPPEDPDFKELIRTALSRREYAEVTAQTAQAAAVFYAALKEGVTWYAPWAPWVKGMLDKGLEQDNGVGRMTVDSIYGQDRHQ
jgi:hypothetical protein